MLEQVNLVLSHNLVIVLGTITAIVFILLGWIVCLKNKVRKLQEKYDFFTKSETVNIDGLLVKTLTELESNKMELTHLQEKYIALHEQVQGCLQHVKVNRYDAFDAMGGEMSYSILLSNAKDEGIILTSIYGRTESRCYAKDIKNGKSKYPLAEEEKELL